MYDQFFELYSQYFELNLISLSNERLVDTLFSQLKTAWINHNVFTYSTQHTFLYHELSSVGRNQTIAMKFEQNNETKAKKKKNVNNPNAL